MKVKLTKIQIILLVVILLFGLTLMASKSYKKPEAPAPVVKEEIVESQGILTLVPQEQSFNTNTSKTFDLNLEFTNGSENEKLDYLKTEISFKPEFIKIPDRTYIDVSKSGLEKIFRVDGPTVANNSGKITIEIGAKTPGKGPSTAQKLTIATITFRGVAKTSVPVDMTIDSIQVVNNRSVAKIIQTAGAKYTVDQ